MDDIVKELRIVEEYYSECPISGLDNFGKLAKRAADEIERLSAAVEDAEKRGRDAVRPCD